jgi:hypothetical protein
LFFSKGNRYKEFFRFMNLVALIEDLEKDRLIIRLPVDQHNIYFIGSLFDAKELKIEGEIRYVSASTGRYIISSKIDRLYDKGGDSFEDLDLVIFDDPKTFERLTRAFSGLVYPREALRNLVKNNFRSPEERRHRQNMYTAWTAITVSFILSLFSLLFQFYT